VVFGTRRLENGLGFGRCTGSGHHTPPEAAPEGGIAYFSILFSIFTIFMYIDVITGTMINTIAKIRQHKIKMPL
jgi:hypothetical protein